MFNANFLHACATPVAFRFVGRLVFWYGCSRFAFRADSKVLYCLNLLTLEKLLDDVSRDKGSILLRVENAVHTGIGVIPENSIELRDLLTADVALDIFREDS